jgi:hypothetical protein
MLSRVENEVNDMEKLSRSSALRYSVFALAVGLSLLLILQVELPAERTPFAIFFMIASLWYSGRNPGLPVIALPAVVGHYSIIRPLHSLMPGRTISCK